MTTDVPPARSARSRSHTRRRALRVELGGGFVEQDHLRIVDECTRDLQTTLHSTGQMVHGVAAAFLQTDERQEVVRPGCGRRPCDAEVACVDEHVLEHGELNIEVDLLRHHPKAGPPGTRIRVGVHPQHGEVACVACGQTREHANGGLPGPIGSEEPEALAALHHEVNAIHSHSCAVRLAEAPGDDGGLLEARVGSDPRARRGTRRLQCACQPVGQTDGGLPAEDGTGTGDVGLAHCGVVLRQRLMHDL